jgi:hypothetical protein
MLTLQKYLGNVQRNLCQSVARLLALPQMANLQGDARRAAPWRLASSMEEFGEGKHDSETQAASVARVSAASGSFEDFTAGGVAVDAK